MRSKSKASRGFGLVEVLVAGSIMALLMMGISKMFSFSLKSTKNLTQKGDYMDSLNTLRLVLVNSDICRCNLLGGNTPYTFSDGSAATQSYSFNTLRSYDKDCNPGQVLLDKNKTASGLVAKEIKVRDFFKIDGSSYTANLHLEIEKTGNGLGGDSYKKDLALLISTETASGMVTLKSCSIASGEGGTRTVSSSGGGFLEGMNAKGEAWGIDLGPSSSQSYTVPSGKTLVMTSMASGNSTSQCTYNGIWAGSGGYSSTYVPSFPVFIKSGETINFKNTIGSAGANCPKMDDPTQCSRCYFGGYLADEKEFPGGVLWSMSVISSTPAAGVSPGYSGLPGSGPYTYDGFVYFLVSTQTYSVPSGKTLVISSIGYQSGGCKINNYPYYKNNVGTAAWTNFRAPLVYTQNQTLQISNTHGRECQLSGYLLGG